MLSFYILFNNPPLSKDMDDKIWYWSSSDMLQFACLLPRLLRASKSPLDFVFTDLSSRHHFFLSCLWNLLTFIHQNPFSPLQLYNTQVRACSIFMPIFVFWAGNDSSAFQLAVVILQEIWESFYAVPRWSTQILWHRWGYSSGNDHLLRTQNQIC